MDKEEVDKIKEEIKELLRQNDLSQIKFNESIKAYDKLIKEQNTKDVFED